jgi:glycosyltransferase involved in cell wall biosynthesis
MTTQRLLLLVPSLVEGFGGTQRMVHSLAQLLAAPERQVFLASFDPALPRPGVASTYLIGPIPRLPLALRPFAYALAAWRLGRLKKKLKIDITISNLWGADLISVLSGGHDRKIALCHINIVGNPINRLMVSFRPLVAQIYRRLDRVVTVSEPLAGEVAALYRLAPGRITHIENFVEAKRTVSRLPSDGLQRFIWCGRLSSEKNLEGLLQAWSCFIKGRSGVQLIFLGEGPLLDRLLRLAADLRLRTGYRVEDPQAEVVFVGRVADPAAYMTGARALVLSSYAEGLPMVILEAMSLGVPVLASDCRGGGVRAAMIGEGVCDPDRVLAEYTPVGALLPVPAASFPTSLAVWREALGKTLEDDVLWSHWREGSLARGARFTSEAALSRWLHAIRFDVAP